MITEFSGEQEAKRSSCRGKRSSI